VNHLREAGFDATVRLGAAELVRKAHGDRRRHAREVAAKLGTVQTVPLPSEWRITGDRLAAAPPWTSAAALARPCERPLLADYRR
jgi:hypothetical protein